MKKILIVVAHTDDETLGCGGAIQNHVKNKDKVFAMSFTNGISARNKHSKQDIGRRANAAKKVSKLLGFKWIKNLNYPDNKLDQVSLLELIKEIEIVKKIINPDIVYTHSFSDLNIDHRVIAEATLTAFRPGPKENLKELRSFEVPSSTDFRMLQDQKIFIPNIFLRINKFWKKKIKALSLYKKEIKPSPNSRSLSGIKNLMKIRGNHCGCEYAESFQLIRKIEK